MSESLTSHESDDSASGYAEEDTFDPLSPKYTMRTRARMFQRKEKERQKAKDLRRKQRQEDEDKEKEEEDVAKAADRLFELFVKPWDGCGKERHDKRQEEHEHVTAGHHNSLDVTYDYRVTQKDYRSRTGVTRPDFPRETGLSRSAFEQASILRKRFQGTMQGETTAPYVCLHDEQEAVERHISSGTNDTDSLIFFPNSLGAIRKTIKFCAVYDQQLNLKTSLHQPISVLVPDEQGNAIPKMLEFKDLPHTYIGHMEGVKNIILIAFPQMYDPTSGKNNFLNQHQFAQLYDQVVRPAAQRYTEHGHSSYLPETQAMADMRAYAKSREMGRRVPDIPRKEKIHHTMVHCELNGPFWESMMEIINKNPHLHHFKDPVILVDIKNIKSSTPNTDLYTSMDQVDDLIEDHFNLAHVPDALNLRDLGCIISPPDPVMGDGNSGYMTPGIMYSWRRCCLEDLVQSLRENGFGGSQGNYRLYTMANLWEMATLSLEPPRGQACYLRNGGLKYLQRYSCIKSLFDAQGTYPFMNEDLSDICVEETVWSAAAAKTGSTNRSREARFKAFAQSKRRVFETLTSKKEVSYGLRQEIRITWALWRAIKRRARNHQADAANCAREHKTSTYHEQPNACWAILTRTFKDYLYGNYDKYLSLLEMCSCITSLAGRTLERSILMRMLLYCIQNLFNCYYPQHSGLWLNSRITVEGNKMFGLGFQDTLPRYGYAWLVHNRVDFESMQINSKIARKLGGDPVKHLLSWYPKAYEFVVQFVEGRQSCVAFLQHAKAKGRLESNVLLVLVHKLLCLYRRTVLLRLRNEIQTTLAENAEQDQIPFSWDSLTKALNVPLNPVSGQKTTCTTPQELFTWLWGAETFLLRNGKRYELRRTSWDQSTYRQAFAENTLELLKVDVSGELAKRFSSLLFQEFFAYHWSIPYPNPNGAFISVTKAGERQIWNVCTNLMYGALPYWGKGAHRKGQPPDYPKIATLSDYDLRIQLKESAWLEEASIKSV